MTLPRLTLAVAAGAASLALGTSTGTGTSAYAADDFGQHVVTCQQVMGFDGQMNPGMHQGYSGWDPSHTC